MDPLVVSWKNLGDALGYHRCSTRALAQAALDAEPEPRSGAVIEAERDLADVPSKVLIAIHNDQRPIGESILKFENRSTATRRVFLLLETLVKGLVVEDPESTSLVETCDVETPSPIEINKEPPMPKSKKSRAKKANGVARKPRGDKPSVSELCLKLAGSGKTKAQSLAAVAEKSVVYTDFGISSGMKYGIAAAEAAGIPVEYRKIL